MTRPPLSILLPALALAAAPSAAAPQAIVQPLGFTDADRLAAAMRRLAVNANDLSALVDAGELSLKLDDLSGAASLFARADRIDPRNGRVKAGMASILVRAERPGEALRYFQMAEGLGLPPAIFAADRGLAFDLIGEQERAQRDYRLALKARPDDETVRRYALSLGIAGQRDRALEQLAPLLQRSDRGAWRARAFVLAMSGDSAEAARIATTMMPRGMAAGLQPFFARLASLPAADRAFAVHFGEVRATPERLADARLTPVLAALGPDPDAPRAIVAAVQPAVGDGRRTTRQRKESARGRPVDTVQRVAPAAIGGVGQGRAPVASAQAGPAVSLPADRPRYAAAPERSLPVASPPPMARTGIAAAAPAPAPAMPVTPLAALPAQTAMASRTPPLIAGQFMATNGARSSFNAAGMASPATSTVVPASIPPVARPVPPAQPQPAPPIAAPAVAAQVVDRRAAGQSTSISVASSSPSADARMSPVPVAIAPASVALPVDVRPAPLPTPLPVTAAAPVSPASAGPAVAPATRSPAAEPAVPPGASPPVGAVAPDTAVLPPTPAPSGAAMAEAPAVPAFAPAPAPAPAPTAIASIALPPSTVASDPGTALPPPAAHVSDDLILAQIVANLSIPAAELGVAAPHRAVEPSPPVVSAAGLAEAKAAVRQDIAEKKSAVEKLASSRTGAERSMPAKSGRSSRTAATDRETEVADKRAVGRRTASRAAAADNAPTGKKAGADSNATSKKLAGKQPMATRKAGKKTDADDAAASEDKAARSNPERIWVQVAGGASQEDLPKAWAAAKAKAPAAFTGHAAYTTPLRATNRVLAGPFKTDAEARSFVNKLARKGVSAFTFTSDKGQPVAKLPSE